MLCTHSYIDTRYKLLKNGLYAVANRDNAGEVIWDSIFKMNPIRGEMRVIGSNSYDLERAMNYVGFREPYMIYTARRDFIRFSHGGPIIQTLRPNKTRPSLGIKGVCPGFLTLVVS